MMDATSSLTWHIVSNMLELSRRLSTQDQKRRQNHFIIHPASIMPSVTIISWLESIDSELYGIEHSHKLLLAAKLSMHSASTMPHLPRELINHALKR
jgi:hypothetical protein